MSEEKDSRTFDLFKKVLSTGVSAAFLTEDAIKNLVNELPIPKESINGLLQNAKGLRDDFVVGVKKEFKSYLDQVDLSKEIDRILDNYDIEVNAKLSFKKKANSKKKQTTKKSESK